MQRYDKATILRMAARSVIRGGITPFPSANPIRLFVEVKVNNREGREASRFCYNGKWSFQALASARRELRKITPGYGHATVIEYVKNGVLSVGNLNLLQAGPIRSRLFYHANRRATDLPDHVDTPTINYLPFRVAPKTYVMVAPGVVEAGREPEFRRLVLHQLRKGTGVIARANP